jgi:hypothetical protein
VVKPPQGNAVSIPRVPEKTEDELAKSLDSETSKTPQATAPPPSIRVYAPDELARVVTALANDDPADPPRRVWARNDEAGAQFISVVLSNSLVTDDGLAKLSGIAGLRHLNLDACREITTRGMAHLVALKDLRKLSLNHTTVDDAGLAHLPTLAHLSELSLIGNQTVTDAGAAHLARCPQLQVLRLKDTRLGDEALAELKSLPQLREVALEGSRVTEKGMADLEQARPGIRIIHPLRRPKRAAGSGPSG